jgi:hypothetical protein
MLLARYSYRCELDFNFELETNGEQRQIPYSA